jgi:hypothetical protein
MEWCATRPELGPVDTYQIERVGIEDVEPAAAVHEHLGKARIGDDGVNDKQVLPQVWNSSRMIVTIKGDGGVGPVEVGRHHKLDSIDLLALQLMTSLSVISCRPTEDHEAVVDDREPVALAVAFVVLGLLPYVSLSWYASEEALHHVTLLESMLDYTLMVRAWLIKHLIKESCPIRGRDPCLIPVYRGNKAVPWPLLACLLLIKPSWVNAYVPSMNLIWRR